MIKVPYKLNQWFTLSNTTYLCGDGHSWFPGLASVYCVISVTAAMLVSLSLRLFPVILWVSVSSESHSLYIHNLMLKHVWIAFSCRWPKVSQNFETALVMFYQLYITPSSESSSQAPLLIHNFWENIHVLLSPQL